MGLRDGFRWLTRPPIGSQVDLSHPLARGLVQCWLFHEGGGPLFSVTKGGLILSPSSSGVTWIGGKDGSAVKFNGSSGFFSTGTAAVTSGAITISAWVFLPANLSSFSGIVSIDNGTNAYVQLGAGYPSGNDAFFNIFSGSLFAATTGGIPLNTWNHVAGTMNSSGSTAIYLNAVQGGGASGASIPSTVNETQIGSVWNGVNRTNFWPGYITNVKIWNRNLTLAEIDWDFIEPYAVIQPPNHRRWFTPVSPPVSVALLQRRRKMWSWRFFHPDVQDF